MRAFLFSWCRRGGGGDVPYVFVGLCYLYLLIGYLLLVFLFICSLVRGHVYSQLYIRILNLFISLTRINY